MHPPSRRLTLLATVLMLGCGAPTSPAPTEQERLEAAVALWEKSGLTSYHYEFRFLCGNCPLDFGNRRRIRVDNGVITQVADLTVSALVKIDERSATIPHLFLDIQDVIAADPYRMSVTYHPTLGYPMTFYVDLRQAFQDDEFGYEAENLMALPH